MDVSGLWTGINTAAAATYAIGSAPCYFYPPPGSALGSPWGYGEAGGGYGGYGSGCYVMSSDDSGCSMSPVALPPPLLPAGCVASFSASPAAAAAGNNCSSPMTSSSSSPPPPQPMLPPCRVCGERASGFHYGVNTCEACKGFFRRSMHKAEKYRCLGNGDCEVVSSRRGTCSACRFKKCVAIGMSKEAIKTGRYTHEKRAKDIAEVKRLERMHHHQQRSISDSVQTIPVNNELEQIIQHITSVYLQHSNKIWETVAERENEYLEQRALKESLFGRLKPLPVDEYMKIYETTGIDVDGRRDLIEGMLPYMEGRIKRFISFAKAIPGFSELPIDDQISIVKTSRLDVWLIVNYRLFNQQQRLYTTVYGKVISEEEMLQLHDAVYVEYVFAINRHIRALKLDFQETCVLAAFVMMSPDRCSLIERSRVEESQEILVNCLQYLFAKFRPNEPLAFARVISLLMELRSLHHLYDREEEKLATQWFDKIHIPPLVYEMWSS